MCRTQTMSRFQEPDNEKVSGECAECCSEFFSGQDVIEINGDYVCDNDCLFNYVGAVWSNIEE